MGLTRISMKELNEKIRKIEKNELILDVRSEEEFKAGHVSGSQNVPLPELQKAPEKYKDDLRKYKTIYVHCQAGGRAGKASDLLSSMGLENIVCVSGSGMADWIAAGFPIEKG